jgi:hypothetical protein
LARPARAGTSGVQVPEQSMDDALPGLLRDLAKRPPPAVRGTEAGQPQLMTEQPGALRRVAAAIADVVEPWANRVGILRYAGMLSDSASQVANIVPSTIMQGVDVAATPIAAGLDAGWVAVLRTIGKQVPRQVFMAEVPARLHGMRVGTSAGLEAAVDVLRTGLRPEDAAKLEQRTGFASGSGKLDAAAEAPLRMLAAADAVFRTSAMGGHLMAEATAAAMRKNGGRAVTPEMVREAAKLPEVVERATYLARRTVLQEDRMVTNWYRKAMDYRPDDPIERLAATAIKAGLAVEVPFVRTPYNVVAQGMGLTPAGLAGVVQDVKLGKSAREVEHRLARVAIGTAVMGVAAADYASGNLTGPYPTDQKEAFTLPPGWRPWSRKVEAGGETYYVPLAYLGPLALPPVVAILAGEAHKQGKSTLSPAWAGAVAWGVGQYAKEETFFEGVAAVGKLFDRRASAPETERQLEQIASQFSTPLVGGGALGREIQRVMGMPARDPEGMLEAILATHPLSAGMVKPRQDVLGRPVSLGLGGPAGTIVRAGVDNDASVIRAFRAAKQSLPTVPPKAITDPDTGGERKLSSAQRATWKRAFGAAVREEWNGAGNPTDADSLTEIREAARTAANETILGQR